MKNRLVASGVAVSVALAVGVVAAPAASATAWTDVFNTRVSGFKAIDAAAKQQNLSPDSTKRYGRLPRHKAESPDRLFQERPFLSAWNPL